VIVIAVNGRNEMVGFRGLTREDVIDLAFRGVARPAGLDVSWSYGTNHGALTTNVDVIQPVTGMAFLVVPPTPAKPAKAPQPAQQPLAIPRSVDEAWAFFGIKKKRATEAQIKKMYRNFMARFHPDKGRADAAQQSLRANAAWDLLRKHCKW
jgi:hypothetical protein